MTKQDALDMLKEAFTPEELINAVEEIAGGVELTDGEALDLVDWIAEKLTDE